MENFDKYILWTQSSSTSSDDILLVDGKNVATDISLNYFSYMSIIPEKSITKWYPVYENNSIKQKDEKNGKSLSRSFSVYQNEEGCTLVKSLYLDNDETERRIAYLFCCKSHNYKEVRDSLKEASRLVERTLNPADLSLISALHYKKYSIYIIVAFILLVLSIIALLWVML